MVELEREPFIGSNVSYCNVYLGIRESDSKFSLLSVGNCVIVQLNHFFVSNGAISKNFALFFVLSSIEVVTELEDEVFCIENFIFLLSLIIVEI